MRHDPYERSEDEPLDVSGQPDLLRLTEEVLRSGRPRALQRGGETVAMLVPLSAAGKRNRRARKPGTRTAEDLAAFRAAAGSWSDVDVARFLADVYAARDMPEERPTVEL